MVVHVKWRRQRWRVEGFCMEVLLMVTSSSSPWPLVAIACFALLPWVGGRHWSVVSVERRRGTRRPIVLVLIISRVVVRVWEITMVVTFLMVVARLVVELLLPHPPPLLLPLDPLLNLQLHHLNLAPVCHAARSPLTRFPASSRPLPHPRRPTASRSCRTP